MFVVGLLTAAPAFAQTGMMGGYSNNPGANQVTDPAISVALQDIYQSQKVNAVSQIDCTKVTDSQFEKLGDAYMGYGINEAQHTAMEKMMGGEGSATLKAAHINMGRGYLGCWLGAGFGSATMPMMGFGMANSQFGRPYGMMGWGSMMGGDFGEHGWFGWVTMLLVWALLIAGIIALVKWLKHKH